MDGRLFASTFSGADEMAVFWRKKDWWKLRSISVAIDTRCGGGADEAIKDRVELWLDSAKEDIAFFLVGAWLGHGIQQHMVFIPAAGCMELPEYYAPGETLSVRWANRAGAKWGVRLVGEKL